MSAATLDFPLGILVFTNNTDCHNMAEILLKVGVKYP
jgi:hypothetical protein